MTWIQTNQVDVISVFRDGDKSLWRDDIEIFPLLNRNDFKVIKIHNYDAIIIFALYWCPSTLLFRRKIAVIIFIFIIIIFFFFFFIFISFNWRLMDCLSQIVVF